jgi:hypothetical protein
VWRRELGVLALKPYPESLEVVMTGWTLQEGNAVSADGRMIVGTGLAPNVSASMAVLMSRPDFA